MARLHSRAPVGSAVTEFPKFEYVHTHACDIQCQGAYDANGRFKVTTIKVGDRDAKPSQRFWDSLCSRFGFGPSIYNYFSPEEVFNRVTEKLRDSRKSGKDEIMVTIQLTDPLNVHPTDSPFEPTLLAVSSPTKNTLDDATFKNLLIHTPSARVEYMNGVFLSRHELRHGMKFEVGGDAFEAGLTLETPIDGYGQPNIYLTLLREVCSNGAVAYTKAFRSGITVGKKDAAESVVSRALESFNNEDGMCALRDRVKSAQQSQASVFEAYRLAKLIGKIPDAAFNSEFLANSEGYDSSKASDNEHRHTARNKVLSLLGEKTGDLRVTYGLAQISSLSEKRMKALPTKCRVYDLFNLASELATHGLDSGSSRTLHGYFGDLISNEYDLENSAQQFTTFDDFVTPGARAARAARRAS